MPTSITETAGSVNLAPDATGRPARAAAKRHV